MGKISNCAEVKKVELRSSHNHQVRKAVLTGGAVLILLGAASLMGMKISAWVAALCAMGSSLGVETLFHRVSENRTSRK